MNSFEEKEKKNKKIGMAVSLGVHALLILLFFFLVAWRRPNPPLPEYGIELNFGITETGSGNIQPRNEQPVQPQPQPKVEEIEEIQEEVKEQPVVEEKVDTRPVQEEVKAQQPVQETGPDVIEKKPEPKPVEKSNPKPVEEKKEEKVVNQNALYPGANTKDKNASTSQGDRGTPGDQGVEQGSVDSRALYGKQGGGDGGPVINLSNWNWDKVNLRKDPSSENGKIVYEIKVDDRGEIIGIRVMETTVSPSVVKYYQDQVEDFTFSFNPSKPGATPASVSTGTITLFIRPQ